MSICFLIGIIEFIGGIFLGAWFIVGHPFINIAADFAGFTLSGAICIIGIGNMHFNYYYNDDFLRNFYAIVLPLEDIIDVLMDEKIKTIQHDGDVVYHYDEVQRHYLVAYGGYIPNAIILRIAVHYIKFKKNNEKKKQEFYQKFIND